MNEDLDAGLGFAPAVSATGSDEPEPSGGGWRSGRKAKRNWRRKASYGLILMVGLAATGGLYGAFASSSSADDTSAASAQVEQGHQLFNTSCITCHGANLQGVTDRGPSLIGVGASATYFQVSTGRMPATGQGAEEYRKTSKFTEAQTDALAAFVESIGGGPTPPQGNLRAGSAELAQGGQLFRLNCASCHGFSGKGAPLSAGKTAPGLNNSTDKQIYTAMQSGPENMPVFSDNQLTPAQKTSIVAYVQMLKKSADPGGNGLDRIGPVSEGLVIWVLGIGAMIATILWIGAKS